VKYFQIRPLGRGMLMLQCKLHKFPNLLLL
jgi:hypothetical protein